MYDRYRFNADADINYQELLSVMVILIRIRNICIGLNFKPCIRLSLYYLYVSVSINAYRLNICFKKISGRSLMVRGGHGDPQIKK